MITKIHFKLEIFSFYLKKNLIFIVIGLVLGSALYYFRHSLLALYYLPHLYTKIIGVEGLYPPDHLPDEITSLISPGLTINTPNDKPTLSSLVISSDIQNSNLEYLFNLNPNLFFHSGKKFTSFDINYRLSGVHLTPVSPSLLKISLDKPFSPLLSLLSAPIFRENFDGLGQYKVKSIQLKEGYVQLLKLKTNQNGQNNLTYRFYPNESDLVWAFQLGEVDEIRTTHLPPELNTLPKIKIAPSIQTNQKYLAIFLNTQNFKEKKLRQSLAYATPKTHDQNERCLGPISASSWAYNPDIKEYNFNPTRAKELFDKSELRDITLTIFDRRLLPQAEAVKDSWQKILKINTQITIENQLDPPHLEAVLAFGGIPHDPDQYYFWHSSQTQTNLTKLNNARIDKLLEDGRQIADPVERKKIYYDFQKYLLEESPAIFLNYPTIYTITRAK